MFLILQQARRTGDVEIDKQITLSIQGIVEHEQLKVILGIPVEAELEKVIKLDHLLVSAGLFAKFRFEMFHFELAREYSGAGNGHNLSSILGEGEAKC